VAFHFRRVEPDLLDSLALCCINLARGGSQCGDGLEQLAAMADGRDTQVLQVFRGELRQHIGIDGVFAKRPFVLLKSDPLRPEGNLTTRCAFHDEDDSVHERSTIAPTLGLATLPLASSMSAELSAIVVLRSVTNSRRLV
jgi:hypothetical protein